MNRIILSTTLALVAATPLAMRGADLPETDALNRFNLGVRFGMNFKADFKNHNRAPVLPTGTGPATGGVDHEYEDGYVRVDSSGNAGGLTWNWGYQNAGQVVGDTMQFHATQTGNSSQSAHQDVTGDPQPGLELVYQRVLGSFASSGHWGLEAGIGYTDIDLHNNRSGTGLTTVTTDAYQLNGVLPPGAGYNGTFQGPGALLGDSPTRTTASSATSLRSKNELSGELYTLRLGPFAEWNFTPKLSLAVSLGLTLAPASVAYDFEETGLSPSGGTTRTTGHTSTTKLLYGPYASGTLRYDFNPHWGVFAGAQFQSLNDLEQSVGGRTARFDPGATIYGTLGVSWRF